MDKKRATNLLKKYLKDGYGVESDTSGLYVYKEWNYIVTKWDNKNLIENLLISLNYEISNPNCSEELSKKVLNGEITTLKEFKAEKHLLEDVETPPMPLGTFECTNFRKV